MLKNYLKIALRNLLRRRTYALINIVGLALGMARKYFGNADPRGRVLVMDGELPLTVTGVLQNQPHHTHLPFDSLSTFYVNAGDWVNRAKTWAGFHTYVLLRPSSRPVEVEQKLPAFVTSFYAGQFDQPATQVVSLYLQPLTAIHLHSKLEKEIRPNSDVAYVYIFSAVALFVLLIACVNFINLTTAQFAKRLREVGIRKVIGAFILNEAAVRELRLEAPIGAVLRWNNYVGSAVGVTENFHFAALHHAIEPLILPHRPLQTSQLLVRMQPEKINEALAVSRAALDRLTPNQLFLYSFLDEDFNRLYRGEDKLSRIFRYFTGIAILVAGLGLFGLATFTAAQRTKEIGVRKVLGASVVDILGLISKEFAMLIAVAFAVAAPVAYFVMNNWLENFAYRIDVGLGVFAATIAVTLLIAGVTIGYRALKAALANPVDSLRYE
jgi:hypothetical protein